MIFLSHANADKLLVDAFVDLLQTGVGIPHDKVFCTSLEGMGIPRGSNFVSFIRDKFKGSTFVISLISPPYYESAFCICELGATWITGTDFFPLLVPPLGYDDLKAVLVGVQSGSIVSKDALNELRDRLIQAKFGSAATGRWEAKRDAFLKAFPRIQKQLKGYTSVPLVKYEEQVKAYDGVQELLTEKDEEIEELMQLIEDLRNTKDAVEVQKVIAKHTGEAEQFEQLVTGFIRSCRGLNNPAVEAMYYLFSEEKYEAKGNNYFWDEVKKAKEKEFITEQYYYIHVNDKHPQMQEALTAAEELRTFLETVSDDFKKQFEAMHKIPLAITNRDFWHKKLRLLHW